MKTKIWLTLVVLFMLTAFKVHIPLSTQILGAWVGPEQKEATNKASAYKLDFLPFGKAYMKMFFSDGRIEELAFTYSVNEQTGTIHMEGRMIIEMQTQVSKNKLIIINSKSDTPREGIYLRTFASRSTYYLGMIVLILSISIISVKCRRHRKHFDVES